MKKREVEFPSANPKEMIRGDLFMPDGEGPWPTIVMGGGWCYVKELIMPEYAEFFVRQGMAALVFDYRCLGLSDGLPRQHLDPWMQIADYRSAIDALSYLDPFKGEVDASRLGIWGISYGGGHVLAVGALDDRVKCIVSQVPAIDGLSIAKRGHGTTGYRDLMARFAENRKTRYLSGVDGTIPHSGDPKKELVMLPHPETKEVFMKIKATTAPRHEHWSTIASGELFLGYDIRPYLPRIVDTPTLMVVAEGDDITLWDEEILAFNQIATTKKKLFVQGATTHMTLYSDMSKVAIAGTEAANWCRQWLIER